MKTFLKRCLLATALAVAVAGLAVPGATSEASAGEKAVADGSDVVLVANRNRRFWRWYNGGPYYGGRYWNGGYYYRPYYNPYVDPYYSPPLYYRRLGPSGVYY